MVYIYSDLAIGPMFSSLFLSFPFVMEQFFCLPLKAIFNGDVPLHYGRASLIAVLPVIDSLTVPLA